jgi:endonuclease-8
MPEGPEAAFIVHTLSHSLVGHELDKIKILKGRYTRHGPPKGFTDFTKQLPLKLREITTHGKIMYFHFEHGWTMTSHLGLMGWWYLGDNSPSWRGEFRNLSFEFKNKEIMTYSDQVSYGTIEFSKTADVELSDALDFMKPTTTWKTFSARRDLKHKLLLTRTIEEALVDQHLLLCGIGNYLKAEILYACHISPSRLASEITDKEWKTILRQSKVIGKRMFKALQLGDDAYERSMRVYMRKTDPYGNQVETYKNRMGRTTHWVPKLQH